MAKFVKVFKLVASYFGAVCVGIFTHCTIERGFCFTCGLGLALGILVAVLPLLSFLEDIKEEE